ncbi:hypothetical protein ABK040_000613 [Willaertia magna]
MSTNILLKRTLHHYNSSPCFSTNHVNNFLTNNNNQTNNTSPNCSRNLVIPKPVKVISPTACHPSVGLLSLSRNNSSHNLLMQDETITPTSQQKQSPLISSIERSSPPNDPIQKVMNDSTPTTGTPERLANEELQKILFHRSSVWEANLPEPSNLLELAPTTPTIYSPVQEDKVFSPSPLDTLKEIQDIRSNATLDKNKRKKNTFSPPTIELSIPYEESTAYEENNTDDESDDDYSSVESFTEEDNIRSIPSTFQCDDEDFLFAHHDDGRSSRKKRNLVTQKDLSFLIELRTNCLPMKENPLYKEDSYSVHQEDVELGLLSFSPPSYF